MRRVYWGLGVFGLLLIAVAIFFMFYANGSYYLRALQLIYTAPKETREEMKTSLFANEKPNTYGGIVAGVMGERVWAWDANVCGHAIIFSMKTTLDPERQKQVKR
jgi:hypothetical protein